MKKLTEKQQAKYDDILSDLQSAQSDIECAIDSYNQAVEEAQAFRDAVVKKMQEYGDKQSAKTEGWADTIDGCAFSSWQSEWDTADVSDTIDTPDFSAVDNFENLPTEIED